MVIVPTIPYQNHSATMKAMPAQTIQESRRASRIFANDFDLTDDRRIEGFKIFGRNPVFEMVATTRFLWFVAIEIGTQHLESSHETGNRSPERSSRVRS